MFKKLFAWFREEERNEEPKLLEARVEECYDPVSRPIKYMSAEQENRLKELEGKIGEPVKAICETFFDWKRWTVYRDWRHAFQSQSESENVKITDYKTGTTLEWKAVSDTGRVGIIWKDLPLVQHDTRLGLLYQEWMTAEESEYATLMARKAISTLTKKKDHISRVLDRRKERQNYRAGLVDRALMMKKYVGIQEGDEWHTILKRAEERLNHAITESLTGY
ncbi:hypothetical protein PaoP5_006 [Pseudomonas phage PaoP5]|uniref:hypothetical protein n=1 Tax=Pseudomonas phage PaoP5 TaxID=1716042 RepID=UPI0007393671|nr:hypothetical protein PaoP5_006 [Pseudomonas phage PaoP5]ALT58288.1 hypothetical protein PaoP5_006 [Pseudomonas phage PaoP5]